MHVGDAQRPLDVVDRRVEVLVVADRHEPLIAVLADFAERVRVDVGPVAGLKRCP
jgi:hypothetical protein